MDANKLKGCIRTYGMTQDAVAKSIGLSLSRLNAKINGTAGAEFTLGEIRALKELLDLSAEQTAEIFFA